MFFSLCKNVEHDWQPQEPELRDRDYIMSDLNRCELVSMTESFTPPPSPSIDITLEQHLGLHHVRPKKVEQSPVHDKIHHPHTLSSFHQFLSINHTLIITLSVDRYIKKFWPKAELTLFGSSRYFNHQFLSNLYFHLGYQ